MRCPLTQTPQSLPAMAKTEFAEFCVLLLVTVQPHLWQNHSVVTSTARPQRAAQIAEKLVGIKTAPARNR